MIQHERIGDDDKEAELLQQLRALPQPAVPERLLARLLDELPTRAAARRAALPRPIRWIAAAIVAALAIAAVSLRPSATGERATGVLAEHVLLPAVNKHKDTNPCNILPPWPA